MKTDRAIINPWLHRFAVITALSTLGLIGIGGLVTSHEAGMAVPDWPTSYGYNMFALPFKFWTGGVFYEHTHRLWATTVGLLVVILTRWLGGRQSRLPLAIVGAAETLLGFGILWCWPGLKGTGHFLTGIGGVVLLASLVWVRNEPARAPLPRLGWLVFALVQFQGLLGGLRVVLFQDQIGVFHAALAQIFFVLLCLIAVLTGRRWQDSDDGKAIPAFPQTLRWVFVTATLMIFFQLVLGATMRHQHAGLSIPDFPLAYGKLWPATDPESIARYNERRLEVTSANPITAGQIELQMAHRVMGLLILVTVAMGAWQARRSSVSRGAWFWLGLIVAQAGLGMATIWSNKAADIATAHVLTGALSLATGVVLCTLFYRSLASTRQPAVSSETPVRAQSGHPAVAKAAAS